MMSDASWIVSHDEFNAAFNGLLIQAKAHNLNTTDRDIHSFILHEAEVISNLFAEARFLQSIIHKKEK